MYRGLGGRLHGEVCVFEFALLSTTRPSQGVLMKCVYVHDEVARGPPSVTAPMLNGTFHWKASHLGQSGGRGVKGAKCKSALRLPGVEGRAYSP